MAQLLFIDRPGEASPEARRRRGVQVPLLSGKSVVGESRGPGWEFVPGAELNGRSQGSDGSAWALSF